MKSMTGFGRAEISTPFGRLTVEISSLNNRFLDFSFRAPRPLYPLEIKVKELLLTEVTRGKVNLSVAFDDSNGLTEQSEINAGAARSYYMQLKSLQKELKLPGELTISDLLRLPDIAQPGKNSANCDEYWPVLEKGIKKALKQLVSMRKKEGATMIKDMNKILKVMAVQVKEIESKTDTTVDTYREKLTNRINEILDSQFRDSVRLEEEIAIFAEKSDVTEEYTRLKSHIDQFKSTLKLTEPVGKRLNFILQEMNREVNTIGSKCAEFSISSTVILMKEEIEKLREMVQNAE